MTTKADRGYDTWKTTDPRDWEEDEPVIVECEDCSVKGEDITMHYERVELSNGKVNHDYYCHECEAKRE